MLMNVEGIAVELHKDLRYPRDFAAAFRAALDRFGDNERGVIVDRLRACPMSGIHFFTESQAQMSRVTSRGSCVGLNVELANLLESDQLETLLVCALAEAYAVSDGEIFEQADLQRQADALAESLGLDVAALDSVAQSL